MVRCVNKLLVLFVLLLIFKQNISAVPNYSSERYVNDFANVLSEETKNYILSYSKDLDDKTGAQLVVVTVGSLEGEDIDDYSLDIMRQWGVGDKEKNNGALILLAVEDRKVKIKVGYGLEGTINDGKAGRILDEYAVPHFKSNDWDSGIVGCYFAVLSELYHEYGCELPEGVPAYYENSGSQTDGINEFLGWVQVIAFILIVGFAIFSKKGRRGPPYGGSFSDYDSGFGGMGGFGGGFGGGSGGSFGGGSAGGGGASRSF